jgi:arylsulfatase A-like enzyme
VLLACAGLALGGCDRSVPERAGGPIIGRRDLDYAVVRSESRPVLRGATHRLALAVPPHAELEIGFGVPGVGPARRSWPKSLEYVQYSVAFEHGDRTQTLVDRRLERPAKGENQWHDLSVDLGALAHQRGTLVLAASAHPSADVAYVVWSNPRLRTRVRRDGTNVILMSIDTLRADRLGCYGHSRPTSPTIDRMAAEGVLFRHAIASSNWTLPSHASMFTGLDPARHGAVRFSWIPLARNLDTLSELLSDQGYETAAFVGGGFVSDFMGFSQGFDRFWENPATRRRGDTLQSALDRAKPWVAKLRGAPFFLFLHTYQVHVPYNPPAPYNALFDPDYRGPYQTAFVTHDARRLLKTGTYDSATVQRLGALYDGEIRALDDAVADLLGFLQTTGLARNTCIVFTSDHGEEFAEHGDLFHWRAKLYEELIRVPLIVWCPGRFRGGRVVGGVVSHTDILPTILDIAGAAPPPNLDGRTLLPALYGNQASGRELAVSESDGSLERKSGAVRSVRSERYKLVTSTIDGWETLVDLPDDPGEAYNLRAYKEDVATQLRAAVSARPRVEPEPTPARAVVTPDDATRAQMRALGYID